MDQRRWVLRNARDDHELSAIMMRRHSAIAMQMLCLSWLPFSGPTHADGPEVSGETIARDAADLANVRGVLVLHGKPFSGFVVERQGDRLLSRTPYFRGKEQGTVEAWYPDGSVRYRRLYHLGHREGTHEGFWPNGQPQSIYRYEDDLFEGEQVAFYKNGVQSERRHYREGHEDGPQQFYDGQGRLVSNYTFKNGRRYGIVGRSDCVSMVTGK